MKTLFLSWCGFTDNLFLSTSKNPDDEFSMVTFSDIHLHDERGAVAGGLAPAILLCGPWGVSQNLILWEPLPWQGIPAGNWRPHPCHGHSRGPPPLGLQRHQGYTHASLLPTLSSQWVSGPQTDGQFCFGVVLGHILAGCKCPTGQLREVTYCGRLIAPRYVLASVLTGWGHVWLLLTTQRFTNGLWCHPSSIWVCPRHPAAFCLSQHERQQ